MKITTKKLEIIFVIVYFVLAILCTAFSGAKCLLGSFLGATVGIADWYVIKFMSVRWLKRGGYSFFENSLRYIIVGLSIWFLFKMKLDIVGIVTGLSVVPFSIMIVSVIALFNNKNITM
jgi:hypothetical protein